MTHQYDGRLACFPQLISSAVQLLYATAMRVAAIAFWIVTHGASKPVA
jgi:hypothetical protein